MGEYAAPHYHKGKSYLIQALYRGTNRIIELTFNLGDHRIVIHLDVFYV